MHKKFLVREHDIFYLSYDEPNAEKNYADICNKIPWVKRVHGVKGSDAAHKACAERAETERFTTVVHMANGWRRCRQWIMGNIWSKTRHISNNVY